MLYEVKRHSPCACFLIFLRFEHSAYHVGPKFGDGCSVELQELPPHAELPYAVLGHWAAAGCNCVLFGTEGKREERHWIDLLTFVCKLPISDHMPFPWEMFFCSNIYTWKNQLPRVPSHGLKWAQQTTKVKRCIPLLELNDIFSLWPSSFLFNSATTNITLLLTMLNYLPFFTFMACDPLSRPAGVSLGKRVLLLCLVTGVTNISIS